MGGGSWFWPDVSDLEGAEDASQRGAYISWFVAGLSVIAAIIMMLMVGSFVLAFAISAGISLGIYLPIGWGLHEISRTAAVIGLVLYLGDLAFSIYYFGPSLFEGLRIVLLIGFINGVRGTFAYHSLRAAGMAEPARGDLPG